MNMTNHIASAISSEGYIEGIVETIVSIEG